VDSVAQNKNPDNRAFKALIVKNCKYYLKNPKVFRNIADIYYVYIMRCAMSNFTVNGVYSYTSANIYSYLGRVPSDSKKLEEAFDEFNITPTGKTDDLKKLDKAMYAEYSEQVQNQIENQKGEKVVPWADLCAQIGVRATGDREKDYAAFNNAIQLLSQSAIDGQAMTYFAGLRTEASRLFGTNLPKAQAPITFEMFQAQFL